MLRKNKKIAFLLFILMMVQLIVPIFSSYSYAKEGRDLSHSKIIDSIHFNKERVDSGKHLFLNVEFSEKENMNIKAGDFFELKFPSTKEYKLEASKVGDHIIYDSRGRSFAKVIIRKENIKVENDSEEVYYAKLVFLDFPNNEYNARGNFRLSVKALNKDENPNGSVVNLGTDFGTDYDNVNLDIIKAGHSGAGDSAPKPYYKSGDINETNNRLMNWYLSFNTSSNNSEDYIYTHINKDIKLSDKVGEGHKLVEDSFKIRIDDVNGQSIEKYSDFKDKESLKIDVKNDKEFDVFIDKDFMGPYGKTKQVIIQYNTEIEEGYENQLEFMNYTNVDMEVGYKPVIVEEKDSIATIENILFIGDGSREAELNSRSGKFILHKVDESENLITKERAYFTLQSMKQNSEVYHLVTNAEGIAEIENIPGGRYYLKEISSPDGFVKKIEPVIVVIDFTQQNGEFVFALKNQKVSGELEIKKVESVTNLPLKNVGFELELVKDLDDNIIENNKTYSGETDDNGSLIFKDLVEGKYILRETKPLEGYQPIEEREVVINYDKQVGINENSLDKDKSIVKFVEKVENNKINLNSLKIIKENNKNERLEGVEFKLTNLKTKEIVISKTDSNGIIEFKDLKNDKYKLEEIKGLSGYIKNSEKYDIDFSNVENNYIEKTIINTLKEIELKIIKKDSKDEKINLSGAVFSLFNEDDELIRKDIKTNEDGVAIVKGLAIGQYRLQETKAPDGYKLNEELYSIDIVDSEFEYIIEKVTIFNDKKEPEEPDTPEEEPDTPEEEPDTPEEEPETPEEEPDTPEEEPETPEMPLIPVVPEEPTVPILPNIPVEIEPEIPEENPDEELVAELEDPDKNIDMDKKFDEEEEELIGEPIIDEKVINKEKPQIKDEVVDSELDEVEETEKKIILPKTGVEDIKYIILGLVSLFIGFILIAFDKFRK